MSWVQTQVIEQYNKPTIEIMLRQGPVFIELYPLSNNRFTIKEDSDYIKASYALGRWCEENIVDMDKYDYGENKRLLKQRHLNFTSPHYKAKSVVINKNFLDDSYSLDRDPGFDDERDLVKTHESLITKKSQKNTSIMKKSNYTTVQRSSRKRPSSAGSIERSSVIIAQESPKRLKFFQPQKKFNGYSYMQQMTEKKRANRSMIIPSTEDIKERVKQAKIGITKRSPATFIRSITPSNKPKLSSTYDYRQKIADKTLESGFKQSKPKTDPLSYSYTAITNNFEEVPPKTCTIVANSGDYGDFGDRPYLSQKPYLVQRVVDNIDPENPKMTESVHYMKFNRSEIPYEGYRVHPDKPTLPYPRSNFLFTVDWDGVIKQFSVSDFSLVKQFHSVIKKGARKIVTTRDSRHLIISDLDGCLSHFT